MALMGVGKPRYHQVATARPARAGPARRGQGSAGCTSCPAFAASLGAVEGNGVEWCVEVGARGTVRNGRCVNACVLIVRYALGQCWGRLGSLGRMGRVLVCSVHTAHALAALQWLLHCYARPRRAAQEARSQERLDSQSSARVHRQCARHCAPAIANAMGGHSNSVPAPSDVRPSAAAHGTTAGTSDSAQHTRCTHVDCSPR